MSDIFNSKKKQINLQILLKASQGAN